jgi:hypothetical protein
MSWAMKILIAMCVTLFAWKVIDARIAFDVVIVNTGVADVDDSSIGFEGFRHIYGILDARANGSATKTYSHAYLIWPKSLEVSWVETVEPLRAFRQVLVVPPPMTPENKSPLELLVEIRNGKACAYPRIYFLTSDSTYKHQKEPPCDFANLPMAELVAFPKKD